MWARGRAGVRVMWCGARVCIRDVCTGVCGGVCENFSNKAKYDDISRNFVTMTLVLSVSSLEPKGHASGGSHFDHVHCCCGHACKEAEEIGQELAMDKNSGLVTTDTSIRQGTRERGAEEGVLCLMPTRCPSTSTFFSDFTLAFFCRLCSRTPGPLTGR